VKTASPLACSGSCASKGWTFLVGSVPVSARAPATVLVPVMRPDRRAIVTVTAGSALAGISRRNVSTGSQTTVLACRRA